MVESGAVQRALIVGIAVAVIVVGSTTSLLCIRIDSCLAVIAVPGFQRCVVRRGFAIAQRRRILDAPAVLVFVVVVDGAAPGPNVIFDTVALVVDVVADLHLPRVDCGIAVVAIPGYQRRVKVLRAAKAYAVVSKPIHVLVGILVVGQATRCVIVFLSITVIVHSVARLRGIGVDVGAQVKTVAALGRGVVPLRLAQAFRVSVHAETIGIVVPEVDGAARGPLGLIRLSVAVVIHAVAFLHGPMVDVGIERLAITDVGVQIVVVVVVAGIADSVTVEILLGRVENERAVVIRVRDPVAVIVVIASVPRPVVIVVLLIGIGDKRAIVVKIGHPVAVVVRIARIAEPVAISIHLARVGHAVAVVIGVRDGIVVHVQVAGIACPVPVQVILLGVGMDRAVVRDVSDPIAVVIAVTCVAQTVGIKVVLVRVDDGLAIVAFVRHTVVVIIAITGIAKPIVVRVGLAGIRDQRAVVGNVFDAVVVVVGVASITAEHVFLPGLNAGDAVAVGIDLVQVGNVGAVVLRVQEQIAIHIRVACIAAEPVFRVGRAARRLATRFLVVIGIRLSRVPGGRAVVVRVGHAVIVIVFLTGIALALGIGVFLLGVPGEGAVVNDVRYVVVVVIIVA